MLIKEPDNQNLVWEKIISSKRLSHLIRRIILLLFGIVIILTSIYLGMALHKIGLANFINESVKSRGMVIPNYFSSLMATPEHIDIDIKFINFQKLVYKRQEALRLGKLISSDDDWIPAAIKYKGQTYRADMRLKGDRPDHWKYDDGWSFKIQLKDNKSIFGMRRFSIQDPRTRGFLREWCFHKFLEYNGLINLRYDFIDVTINGKHQPIYGTEENFEKTMIENNNYREGPIIRFNTMPYWEGEGCTWSGRLDLPPIILGTSIEPFEQQKIISNDNLLKQFNLAKNLLELFRQNKLPVSKVFDIDKLARFFAILDLGGHHHPAALDNLKFYYNPITSLIEPIGYDNQDFFSLNKEGLIGFGERVGEIEYSNLPDTWINSRWIEAVFKDKEFFAKYIQAIEKISEKEFLDNFFNKINKELKEKLRILHKRYPWYSFKEKAILYENQEYIKDFLTFKMRLQVYFNKYSADRNSITLAICNIRALPVEILELIYKDTIAFKPPEETIVQAYRETDPLSYSLIEFQTTNKFTWSDSAIGDLRINYRILGASKVFQENIIPWTHLDTNFIKEDFIRQPPNIDDFSFLVVDRKTKRISFKSGEWDLNCNLIIPKGYIVFAETGLKLNLSNSAKILSYSPIIFIGSEDNPIVISSNDSTGQGIVVMSEGMESRLEYVNFDNLSNPSQAGWQLSGAVTFYESPVIVSHCQFMRNRSEDALNVIRTKFKIDNTLFIHTSFDAFDSDFSKGSITNSSFFDCGNDAVDVSGSIVEIENIVVNKTGDKGISIGEKSIMTTNGAEIKNTRFAIASKDMSHLNLNNAIISNSKIGIALYQKKPEFGPASVKVAQIKLDKVDIPYLVEEESQLYVKEKRVESNQKVVKDILNKYLGL